MSLGRAIGSPARRSGLYFQSLTVDTSVVASSLRRSLRFWLSVAAVAGLVLSVTEALIPELHDGDAVVAASALTQGTRDVPSAPHSPQSAHICHCLHAHALAPVVPRPLTMSAPDARTGRRVDEQLPRSAFEKPPLRPPIA